VFAPLTIAILQLTLLTFEIVVWSLTVSDWSEEDRGVACGAH
jgi:hypothetical protein